MANDKETKIEAGTVSRRNLLAKMGLVLGAAYVAPAMVGLDTAAARALNSDSVSASSASSVWSNSRRDRLFSACVHFRLCIALSARLPRTDTHAG